MALELQEQHFGSEGLPLSFTLEDQAVLQWKRGDYEDARRLLERGN